MNPRHFFAVTAFAACALHAFAADPFAVGVRTTEPLAPVEQQKTFRLPPGFEIQLVAAEPDLRKPMNMAFDAAGRLWVSESREYPFPAKAGEPPRDSIRIFSDFGPDGRARKITVFADGLNIPIGLHPFRSPSAPGAKPTWKCIAWSIPNIWLLEDTDDDGKADKREILLGPLGWERDTHGNQASFRYGMDGWIYATHGFNNTSTFRAKDGSSITLQSGNTYRFRPDGSRIEQFTWGQVNPFGMCMDPLGNFYTADCHSSPIYQLIPGAYYPSFGKPHDGLGYAPTVIQHSHGSTAIGGIVYLSEPSWPSEFFDNILVGNVMTSRINRDQITFHGSSPKGKEVADFLSTSDPWFRPVDMQFGPDGALYIADFYNRIIGHYEVSLTHPGRDRERGRLWRVVYNGKNGGRVAIDKPRDTSTDFTQTTPALLISELMSANPKRRALAFGELEFRTDAAALDILKAAAKGHWHFRQQDERDGLMSGALWLLQRRGALDEETLLASLKDTDHTIRLHALRIVNERTLPSGSRLLPVVIAALKDENAHVQRVAAETLAKRPDAAHIPPLLALLHSTTKEDVHLRHAVRIALRNQLVPENSLAKLDAAKLTEADSRALADVAVAVANADAGAFLLKHLRRFREDRETTARHLRHATRHADEAQLDGLAAIAQETFASDLNSQFTLFKSVQEGAAQRGTSLQPSTLKWGAELATKLLAASDGKPTWRNFPVENRPESKSPWAFQERSCADGTKAQFMSSFPNGEQLIGTLRSATFPLPAKLSFYLCGHDGAPDKPAQKKNTVRLCDATTRAVLREAAPPRSDTAQKISWALADIAGKEAFIEITDGDTGTGFAWLAFGRFEPALPQLVLNSPIQLGQRQQAGAELARDLRLGKLEKPLAALLAQRDADVAARGAAAEALLSGELSAAHLASFTAILSDANEPAALREKVAQHGARLPALQAALVPALATASARLQPAFARALASHATGAQSLLQAVESGKAPAALLLDAQVKERLPANLQARAAALTKELPKPDDALQKMIAARLDFHRQSNASVTRGRELFQIACAACHQKDGVGQQIGPQLDGIGARGTERVIEDVLDPNRNVDVAFRYQNVKLKDGQTLALLQRRVVGEAIVFADLTGKELTVPKSDITAQTATQRSLMPDNFGTAISPQQLSDLLAFLLAK